MDKTAQSREDGSANGGWMLTFADLLALMLTFFVLVFSMSTIHHDSWSDVVETMRDQFDPNYSAIAQRDFDHNQVVAKNSGVGLNLNYLRALVERDLTKNLPLTGVTVRREPDRVVVSIPASSLFVNKSGQFMSGVPAKLKQFSGSLTQIKNKLVIASHTNDLPVSSQRFRSNWELSVTRAQLVAGVIVDAGYVQPLTVVGHADSKFDKVRTTARQLDAQERIDFVILGEAGAKGPFDVF